MVDIANRMSKQLDVIVAYSTRKQTPKDFEKYFNENIKLVKVKNFTRNINPIQDLKAIFEVKKLIKAEKPDIVHMHSSKAGAIGRLAISRKQAKLFYTPHSYAFCKKDEPNIKIQFYKIIERILGLRKCTTIACSKGEYEESLRVTKNSLCINNGIDIEDMEQAIEGQVEKTIDTNHLKVCTVGRIGYQKNPGLFNKIAQAFPDIQFTWIGDGNLREILKSPNIKILGWCDRKTALKHLYQNDIFILPSLWEGLPITLLEAMYYKKICIVSNVTGNRDVIENGQNGFVCKKQEDYYQLIEKIKNAEVDYLKIKDKARQTVVANYNMEQIAKQYLEIYEKGVDYY